MVKVMNFSVVFFTRRYMSSNKNGEGSGQFSHSSDLKPDQILSTLIENGLVVGGNLIKNARNKKEELNYYSSFCKQLPSVIQNNSRIKRAFEVNITSIFTSFAKKNGEIEKRKIRITDVIVLYWELSFYQSDMLEWFSSKWIFRTIVT